MRGAVRGAITGTNSFEALQESWSKGHRYFELDFNWTSDDKHVCVHDWGSTYDNLFPGHGPEVPAEEEFARLKMSFGLTQLTAEDAVKSIVVDPDRYLVTDVK